MAKKKRTNKDTLDKLDLDLITELQRDSSRTVNQIKVVLKKPATTIHARINKLKRSGILKKQTAVLDYKKIGLGTTVLILMKLSYRRTTLELITRLRKVSQISEMSIISGDYQVMAKAHFKNNDSLEKFLYDTKYGLRYWDLISDIQTIVVFSEEDKPLTFLSGEIGKIDHTAESQPETVEK